MENQKLRILVIEDNAAFQEDARQQLAVHDVTIMSDFNEFICSQVCFGEQADREAIGISPALNLDQVDVLLTDIEMPGINFGADKPREMIAAGVCIAFRALVKGVKKIGVLSSASHAGKSPMARAFMEVTVPMMGFGFDDGKGEQEPLTEKNRKLNVFKIGNQKVCVAFDALEVIQSSTHKRWDWVLEHLIKE